MFRVGFDCNRMEEKHADEMWNSVKNYIGNRAILLAYGPSNALKSCFFWLDLNKFI